MFYFDSNMTVSLQCVALVFWKAYFDRMSSGWLFLGIPIKKCWINECFPIFLVNQDSTFTKTICGAQLLLVILHQTFQMSQSFDWYNSVLQVLKSKNNTKILFVSVSHW